MPTAASSGLRGCLCAAFSSHRVTRHNCHPPWQGRGRRTRCVACVCAMRRARDPDDAFGVPLPQVPASSFPTSIHIPAPTFGIKIPDPFTAHRDTFEKNRRGRRNSLSFHFPSWLNFHDSSHLQSIYLAGLSCRRPGGQRRCVCPSGRHVVPAGCAVVVGMGGGGGVEWSGSSVGGSSVFCQDDTSQGCSFVCCLFVLGGISSDYILIT